MEFSNSSPHWELGPAVPLRPWQAPDQPRCEAAPAKAARASSREVSPAGPSARAGRSWARSLLGLLGCTQAVGCMPLPALPAGEQEEEGGSETGGAYFGSLPTHLLPLILGHLQCASRLTHFNVWWVLAPGRHCCCRLPLPLLRAAASRPRCLEAAACLSRLPLLPAPHSLPT